VIRDEGNDEGARAVCCNRDRGRGVREHRQFERDYVAATGIRPGFMSRLEQCGVRLPASAFRERIMLRD